MFLHLQTMPTAGEDYTEQSVAVTIPANERNYNLRVPLLDDSVVEGDEYFSVRLTTTDTSLVVAIGTVMVTILEDDSKWSIWLLITGAYSTAHNSRYYSDL